MWGRGGWEMWGDIGQCKDCGNVSGKGSKDQGGGVWDRTGVVATCQVESPIHMTQEMMSIMATLHESTQHDLIDVLDSDVEKARCVWLTQPSGL